MPTGLRLFCSCPLMVIEPVTLLPFASMLMATGPCLIWRFTNAMVCFSTVHQDDDGMQPLRFRQSQLTDL